MESEDRVLSIFLSPAALVQELLSWSNESRTVEFMNKNKPNIRQWVRSVELNATDQMQWKQLDPVQLGTPGKGVGGGRDLKQRFEGTEFQKIAHLWMKQSLLARPGTMLGTHKGLRKYFCCGACWAELTLRPQQRGHSSYPQ